MISKKPASIRQSVAYCRFKQFFQVIRNLTSFHTLHVSRTTEVKSLGYVQPTEFMSWWTNCNLKASYARKPEVDPCHTASFSFRRFGHDVGDHGL